jgi:coenzyme F420-reducing hydrogenase delta subunit
MTITLIVIMLVVTNGLGYSKVTTETKLKSEQQCLIMQGMVMQKKYPANVRLISVTCLTKGKI